MPSTVVNHEALIELLNSETVHVDPALTSLRDQWWDLSRKEIGVRQQINDAQERLLRILGGKETVEMTMLIMTGNVVAPQQTPEDAPEDHPVNGS